ncbi:conserved hypothetical integral membrane protein [Filomicrobium insigne]|uniref:Conserved hypothetical integral membrane protein n=1 Tax=Filomicrobium insigne TaxID=418854 RepID=A0A1H0N896_9HYPH|nr:YeiH family protein [Filomicrobium insigne]SDO88897.1 conserved hypothetical integral membrane protein [Filomicrobium insigne]
MMKTITTRSAPLHANAINTTQPPGRTAFQPYRKFGIWPGIALVSAIAGLAILLRQVPGLGIFSPMILSILIGMAFHNIIGTPRAAKAGVTFALRRILRLGVILLGLQLTAWQIASVGITGFLIITVTLVATFAFTIWFGRIIGVDRKLAELIAAGTSICGASAVLATNTVTAARDEDVAYAVASVTIFGSIAMLLYPLTPAFLGLSAHDFGLWTGASIHEVAQVVAAAFQHGQEAGEFGTIAKLSRVILLAPLVVTLGLLMARRARTIREDSPDQTTPVPWFVFGFLAMVVLNSAVAIPEEIKAVSPLITTFLLSIALAAMGLETDLSKLREKGIRPFILGLAASLFIAALSLILVKLFA